MTLAPVTLADLLDADVVAPVQDAIATTLQTLNPGLKIVKHPGKVDLSELVAETVVQAPGVGIGFSRMRESREADGVFCVTVDWIAYIVVQPAVIGGKRREKEQQGLAIGARLLAILADEEASLWACHGILPVESTPGPELKPLYTVRDQSEGMAYYTVTWSQTIADLGTSGLPQGTGRYDEESGLIIFDDPADLAALAHFIPAMEEPDA